MNPDKIKQLAGKMIQTALRSVDPYMLIKEQIKLQGSHLILSDQKISLTEYEHIYILGAGKATAAMAEAFEEILTDYISGGKIIVKYEHGRPLKRIEVLEAGHPIPDSESLNATVKLLELANNCTERDLVLFLLSGGGSALLESLPENFNLDDLAEFNKQLLACGAAIEEINVLRKHISLVKGGQFAEVVNPARLITFILSDVIGDPLESIASGPTAPDSSTFADVQYIIEKYDLFRKLPSSILEQFQAGLKGLAPETPKSDAEVFNKVDNIIIGNNRLALNNLKEVAEKSGFKAQILTDRLQGEAREIAKFWAAIIETALIDKRNTSDLVCFIGGGEPTVTLRGPGLGGRNQELVLAVLDQLKHIRQPLYFCSIGTDGTDGPTDAAGAWINHESFAKSQLEKISVQSYLNSNDSYHFFEQIEGLIKTGPTGTNVMDMMFCLV